MHDKSMYINELGLEPRRALLDTIQIYEVFLEAKRLANRYRGWMRWKTSAGKEYLQHVRNRRGYGPSLGVRSPETEAIQQRFDAEKADSGQRLDALREQLVRRAGICVAYGLGRVPKVPADVIRLLDERENLMGRGLAVLGTNAIYAYEAAAGVHVDTGLMATGDIDLLFDAGARLTLSGEMNQRGLIGILQEVDKSFRLESAGGFRATNRAGFMVELIKPTPSPPFREEPRTLSGVAGDLTASEIENLVWLKNAPVFEQIAIAEDGFPVRLHVPDPRFFAVYKAWLSRQPRRAATKRPRDRAQAEAAAQIAGHYLGLSFDDDVLRVFPREIRNTVSELAASSKPLPPGW